MIDVLVEWAGQTSTAWAVLAGAALIVVVISAREREAMFWGEFTDDDESAV